MDIDSCLTLSTQSVKQSVDSVPQLPEMATPLSAMSVDGLSNWLKTDGGIPDKYCEVFKGRLTVVFSCTYSYTWSDIVCWSTLENYIDGEVFVSLTEQDIKEMVPPIGLLKKILKLRQVNHIVLHLRLISYDFSPQSYFPSASPMPSRHIELDSSSTAALPQSISNPSTLRSLVSKVSS